MTTEDESTRNLPWVNYEKAMERVGTLDDVAAEQFVMRAVTLVINSYSAGAVPDTKLDMLFFVDRMIELFRQRDALVRIFAGEDLRWWEDDKQSG